MTDAERERLMRRATREVLGKRTALQRNTRDEIVRLLIAALAQIEATLAAAPSDYQLWSLPRLGAEIRQILGEFGEAAGAEVATAMGRAYQLGADIVEQPLTAAGIGIRALLPVLSLRQLVAMRAFATDRIKNISTEAANKINSELGLVVIGTQAPGEAVGKVRDILGEPSRARAVTIVRTSLGQAFSVAEFERLKDAARRLPGLQKQWRRSGKLHPRLHHEIADGQIRDIDAPFELRPFGALPVKLMHPHDPKAPAGEVINCGCVAIPYMKSWDMSQPGRSDAPSVRDLDPAPPVRELLEREAQPARRTRAPQA